MNEFDDRELGDALRHRAGAATDGYGLEAARSAVVTRAGRIRRRRVVIAGGAAMTGLIAAAAFVIGPGTGSVVTTPADQTIGSVPISVDSSHPATSSVSTEPDQTGPDRSTADTTPPVTALPNPTTVPAVVPSTVPPTVSPPPTTAPAVPETTIGTTTTSAPAPDPPPSTETYSSAGGSITVRWDGVALSLQQVTPGAGFTEEVEDERADRIRVRFQGDGGDFRIEIRVENGEVVRVE